ncbi:MAG: hypothetical protein J2P19_10765 [Pseudonocardia sp.]|nr:hypothetical protein [Pseudonocardia sp.]
MPDWLTVDETNTPMMYSWVNRSVLASNAQINRHASTDRITMPLRIPLVAAARELPRQEPVLTEDRRQDREPVERGIRGEDQDRRDGERHQVEQRRPVPEHRAAT